MADTAAKFFAKVDDYLKAQQKWSDYAHSTSAKPAKSATLLKEAQRKKQTASDYGMKLVAQKILDISQVQSALSARATESLSVDHTRFEPSAASAPVPGTEEPAQSAQLVGGSSESSGFGKAAVMALVIGAGAFGLKKAFGL